MFQNHKNKILNWVNIPKLLFSITRSVPGVFGNRQNENLDVIKQMLLSSLQPTESEALQMQAVKAVGAFILLHDKEPAIQKHFADLLLPLMQVSSFSNNVIDFYSISSLAHLSPNMHFSIWKLFIKNVQE